MRCAFQGSWPLPTPRLPQSVAVNPEQRAVPESKDLGYKDDMEGNMGNGVFIYIKTSK